MSIIYVLSSLMLFILTILLKKSDKKLEIIKTTIMLVILKLAYNAFICFIMNQVNIPITLLNLTIINTIISILIIVGILRKKQIQAYELDRKNIIILVSFILLTLIILVFLLGNNNKIRYLTGDPQNHYLAMREFSNSTTLSTKGANKSINGAFLPMGYINGGILSKIMKPYITTLEEYNIFIIFEGIIYTLAGISFCFLIKDHSKGKYKDYVIILFSLIYILGYPLNSWISGFHYLTIGILYVTCILWAINSMDIFFKYELIVMMLLNFGLIFSYCLFCPFVYLAECIYYIYKYFKDDKRKLILLILITLILPGILGVIYMVIDNLKNLTTGLTLPGYVYKNLWSNFILFIPFVIYSLYYNIKNKKITIETIMLSTLLLYIILLAIGIKNGKCSEYYFYKNYFILWILMLQMAVEGFMKFGQKTKTRELISLLIIVVYTSIFIISLIFIMTPQKGKRSDTIKDPMEVISLNSTMLIYSEPILTTEEFNLFLEVEKIIDDNWREYKNGDEILFITDTIPNVWIRCLTGYANDILKYDVERKQEKTKVKLLEDTYNYIVITKDTEAEKKYTKYVDFEKYEMIFKNNIGEIYKKGVEN